MTYQPLPPYLTIRPSEIHGLGLFATEDIEAETNIGSTHFWDDHCGNWIRTPLGGFYNHSYDPNCVIVEICRLTPRAYRVMFAERPIKAGEEITCRYTLPEYQGKL